MSFIEVGNLLLPATSARAKALLDVAAIAQAEAPEDWHGHSEMPAPEPDLTSYADALRAAKAACPHRDAGFDRHYLLGWGYVCDACGKWWESSTAWRKDKRA